MREGHVRLLVAGGEPSSSSPRQRRLSDLVRALHLRSDTTVSMAWLRHGEPSYDWRRLAERAVTLDDARTTTAASLAAHLGTQVAGKVRGLHVRSMLRQLSPVDVALLVDGVGRNVLERCPSRPRTVVTIETGARAPGDAAFVIERPDLTFAVPPIGSGDAASLPWTIDGRWIRHAAVESQRQAALARISLSDRLVIAALWGTGGDEGAEAGRLARALENDTERAVSVLTPSCMGPGSEFAPSPAPDPTYEGAELVDVGRPLVLADVVLALGAHAVDPELLLEAVAGGAIVAGDEAALGALHGSIGFRSLPPWPDDRGALLTAWIRQDDEHARRDRIAAAREAYGPDSAAAWLLERVRPGSGERR